MTQYIDKDALVMMIKHHIKEESHSYFCKCLLSEIDALEVKEVGEKPATEDLGEYINELSKQFPEVYFAKLSRIAVRVAQWQKEQILKDAIDAVVHRFGCTYLKEMDRDAIVKALEPYKDGDKVKVIIKA